MPDTFDPADPYKARDPSVTKKLNGLLAGNSDFMRQAETDGYKAANRRGLLNSSMAVGAAQDARIRAALPIASQEAGQIQQQNLTSQQIGSTEKIADLNIKANDREKAASLGAAMENNYATMFGSLAQNADIPADVRDSYLAHAGRIRDSNLALVEQFFGIDLVFSTPGLNDEDIPEPDSTSTGTTTTTPTTGGNAGAGAN